MKNSIILSSYDDITNPHYGGGGAIALHEIAKWLKKSASVTVLSWNHSGNKSETIDGVRYERIGHPAIPPKVAMALFQLSLPILAMVKNYSLWFESFGPPFTTAVLPLFTKKKVVGIVHMLAAEDMERKYRLPFRFIESFGLKKYSHIVTTSENMKTLLVKAYPNAEITVIGNGVTLTENKKITKKNQILFLGRIEVNQKGLDLLINAFTIFSRNNKETELLIAGTGLPGELDKLQRLIAQHRISQRVKLLGRVTGQEKARLLKESRIVVIPSRFETYSLTALEAMAASTPVVCFAIPGLTWISDTTAVKVPPYDVKKMADVFHSLVSNRLKGIRLGKQGRAYAENFSWETIGTAYKEYIGRL